MSKNQNLCVKCKKNEVVKPYTPFCSQRCQLLDFSNWATESYKIPVEGEIIEIETKNDDSDA